MRQYLITPSMEKLAKAMKRHASSNHQFYDGRNIRTPYFQNAKRIHVKTGTSLLFTRDIGMHASGWFKNPDYDRCYHLSISFWDFGSSNQPIPRPYEHDLARLWCKVFYGDWIRYVWTESSSLPELPSEVWHYRVMCNKAWQPIIPRKEVYSREFIEKGWKSFSDQQGDHLEIVGKLIDRLD